MKTYKQFLFAMIATVGVAISATAQQPASGTNSDKQMSDMKSMQGMQMQNGQKDSGSQMMQGCRKHMQSMMDGNAQTTKDIEAAKESNDPAKMRVALDEAEKALSPMNEHMKGCMKMMENMHGKSCMMGSSSTKDSGQASDLQK